MNITTRHFLQRPYRRNTFLEVLMVICIIAALLLIAMREMSVAIVKAEGLSMFSDFATGRDALLESFALNGVWPDRQSLNLAQDTKNAHAAAEAVQGVISLERQARHDYGVANKILSLRPATGPSNATVLWVCGNAAVPQGMQVSGVNRTSLKQAELYVACR